MFIKRSPKVAESLFKSQRAPTSANVKSLKVAGIGTLVTSSHKVADVSDVGQTTGNEVADSATYMTQYNTHCAPRTK